MTRAWCWLALAITCACKPSEPRTGPGVELEQTAKALWTACNSGSAASCLELDRVLDESRATGSAGVTSVQLRSSYNSDRLVRRACDAGDAHSCYEVAKKQPSRQRQSYLERACSLGDVTACGEVERVR